MATNREERLQQRMRGAQRHQVQEATFDLFFPEPEPQQEPESEPTDEEPTEADATAVLAILSAAAVETEPTASSIPSPAPVVVRASPNTSAKRRRLDGDDGAVGGPPRWTPSVVLATAAARPTMAGSNEDEQEQVDESPMDAPGSGRRRSVVVGAAADRTAVLHQAFSGSPLGDQQVVMPSFSSPASSSPPRMGAPRRSPRLSSGESGKDAVLSPELASAVQPIRAGRTSLFSKLAHARQSAADSNGDTTNGLDDELSSPSVPGVEPATIPSSPLARKSANARAGRAGLGLRRPGRSLLSTPAVAADADADELSPEQQPLTVVLPSSQPSQTRRTAEVPTSSPPAQEVKRRRTRPAAVAAVATVEEEEGEGEGEGEGEAEAIDEVEAAQTIGKRRPHRNNVHEPSPELGSDRKAAEPEGTSRAKRRRPGPQQQSPAVQKQPRAARDKVRGRKPKEVVEEVVVEEEDLQEEQEEQQQQKVQHKQQTHPKTGKARASAVREPTIQKKRKRRQKEAEEEDGGVETEGDSKTRGRSGPPVPIAVQRFVQRRRRTRAGKDEGDNDEDSNSGNDNDGDGEMPYANRGGVNVIDVLAQVCEDIVAQKLEEAATLAAEAKTAAAAGDSSAREARRDALARQRALEAFQAELRARLLAQAAAVDAAFALRRRVREAHRQKLALREEILRIRAEREQVALRMDALRARHQAASRRAMVSADISTAMHDVDLAVEQGRAAPELTAAQQKTADLGNLELAVSRVAEQLCGGGMLRQLVDFNAFLERTAVVLEGRRT